MSNLNQAKTPWQVTTSEPMDVAVKEFGEVKPLEQDSCVLAEANAWNVYHKASMEARMMIQLRHPHILGLMGLTLRPLRLVVELAPLGDLKSCTSKFRKIGIKLTQTTIKITLIQVR